MDALNPATTALVFVDCQIDFIDGILGTKEAQEAMPNVLKLAQLNVAEKYRTMDTHSDQYMLTLEGQHLPIPHTIENTLGWENPKELNDLLMADNCITIRKPTFGSVGLATNIARNQYLKHVVFCGFDTNICVIANILTTQAYTYGHTQMIVIEDACAGTTPDAHKAAIETLKSCQVISMTTDEFIHAL